jgi:hypothetical protein
MATRRFSLPALTLFLTSAVVLSAEPVAVRHVEGLVHGFLSLKAPDGKLLASGDLTQNANGDRVTSRLVFHFIDGSLSDETAVFSQRGTLLLLTDHLIQKGPSFATPLEMTIDRAAGRVVVRYENAKHEPKVDDEKMALPADLANGMFPIVMKNVRHDAFPPTVSYVAATPGPRLIKMKISVAGSEPFVVAGLKRSATHYVLKADIGGLAGLVAPIVGKQPPDSHIWILEGEAPAFVKSQAPMFMGGPLWQTELVSPVWPRR